MSAPATNEERQARSAPWRKPQWLAADALGYTELGLGRVESLIRFSHRWQDFWYGREWYIGSGFAFEVVDALAAIEGRRRWDWRGR